MMPSNADRHPEAVVHFPNDLHRPLLLILHQISPGRIFSPYEVSEAQFQSYLEVIRQGANRFFVQITFDDGHLSNYRLALPLLERYGIRATFFVTVGRTGVSSEHMSWSQLKELVALGHEVGSHSWSHPDLTRCSQASLDVEVRRSREALKANLQVPVRKISIPFGRYSLRVLRACAAAGYESAYIGDPWVSVHHRGGVRVYGRFSVPGTFTAGDLRRILQRRPVPHLCLQMSSELRQGAKLLLGERFYRSVWIPMITCRRRAPVIYLDPQEPAA